jgi:hypothetical protein
MTVCSGQTAADLVWVVELPVVEMGEMPMRTALVEEESGDGQSPFGGKQGS